jgi:glycosyltransferase involved in cell wall biosynthesis
MSHRGKAGGISVVVPTRNRSAFLKECLDALMAQIAPADELLVMDDGSTDDTRDMLRSRFPDVRVIGSENRGKSSAVNRAIADTTRPFVWIVDDDDIIADGARDKLMALFDQDPSADFVYGRHDRFSDGAGGRRVSEGTGYWRNCEPEDFYVATLEDLFVHQPGMIVRRALYGRVGLFDERLTRSMDYDMLIRLGAHGRAVGTDDIVFHQRLHAGVRGTARQPVKAGNRGEAWIEADKGILLRHLESVDFRSICRAASERQFLLQRATILARRKLWSCAMSDLRAAAKLGRATLSPSEKVIVRKATMSKYGCEEVLGDRGIDEMVAELALSSRTGRAIARELSKSLRWRVKHSVMTGSLDTAAAYSRRAMMWYFGTVDLNLPSFENGQY